MIGQLSYDCVREIFNRSDRDSVATMVQTFPDCLPMDELKALRNFPSGGFVICDECKIKVCDMINEQYKVDISKNPHKYPDEKELEEDLHEAFRYSPEEGNENAIKELKVKIHGVVRDVFCGKNMDEEYGIAEYGQHMEVILRFLLDADYIQMPFDCPICVCSVTSAAFQHAIQSDGYKDYFEKFRKEIIRAITQTEYTLYTQENIGYNNYQFWNNNVSTLLCMNCAKLKP